MPAGTGARPPWVSTHPVASSVVWVGLHPSGVQPSGVRATGCIVRVRPSSGLVSARPSGRVRLVPRPAATLGNSSVQRGSLTTATGRAACGLPRPGGSVDGRGGLDAGATARVVRWSAGRRPRTGRIVLRLGRWLRSTAAPTGQASPPCGRPPLAATPEQGSGLQRDVAAPAAWPVILGWMRDYCAWLLRSLAPAVDGPDGPPSLPARMACGPSAAQACSERSRLGVDTAVTCENGGGRDRV
jgi:hypothetical protein